MRGQRIFAICATVACVVDALVLWFGYLFKWYTLTGDNESGLVAAVFCVITAVLWVGFLFNWDVESMQSARHGEIGPVQAPAPVKHRGQRGRDSLFKR